MERSLVDRVVANLSRPREIPGKLKFRWLLTPYHLQWARRRFGRERAASLAPIINALEARRALPSDPDRYGPVFEGWPVGLPDCSTSKVLDSHFYRHGNLGPANWPEDLPQVVRALVERPELGSSKSKLAPIFFDLARRSKACFEAGVYTGVTSQAILAGLPADGCFFGSDIILHPRAKERLAWALDRQRVLFEAPVRAIELPAGSLDLIFLDMVHDVRNLRPTLDHVLPWLAPGGVLAIDDVGFRGSIYTPESLKAQNDALALGLPIERVPPLTLAKDAYAESVARGHMGELGRFLNECGRTFVQHHVADGGGTVFLWDRPRGRS